MPDRIIVYPGAIPLDSDLLSAQRNMMVGLGFLAQATLGTATTVDGLACTAQTVPNMTVNVGPGSIIALSTVDGTAFGSLAADNADPLVKQGINLTATVLTLTAPTTSGQSVNYLIEAAFQESDAVPVVLPYYNAAAPAVPFSGPGNAGTAQNTQRIQRVNIQAKAGTPATSGTQATPAPDSGFVGLWVVTVAYAQTSIVAGNIARFTGAPFTDGAGSGRGIQPGRLLGIRVFASAGTSVYTPTPGTNSVEVEGCGGGGGSTGAIAAGSGNAAVGTPGNAGAYGRARFTSGFAGVTVTVGAGGTAGNGANAGSGGTSSFGALLSMPGGPGGQAGTASSGSASGSNGNISGLPSGANIVGGVGGLGSIGVGNTTGQVSFGGSGGASFFGAGGTGAPPNSNANPGSSPGSGAGGTVGVNNTGILNGAAGPPGIVIVKEYA